MYRRASKHRETHKEGNARNVLMLGVQTTPMTSGQLWSEENELHHVGLGDQLEDG